MTVYVDDAFAGEWGKWTGGGHLQADTLEELHAALGLRRAWFQSRPGRPETDHYDLTASKRDAAILAGAIPEAVEDGSRRRRRLRAQAREQVEGMIEPTGDAVHHASDPRMSYEEAAKLAGPQYTGKPYVPPHGIDFNDAGWLRKLREELDGQVEG